MNSSNPFYLRFHNISHLFIIVIGIRTGRITAAVGAATGAITLSILGFLLGPRVEKHRLQMRPVRNSLTST